MTALEAVKNAVKMENITKRFGTIVANNGINLELHEGEILSLLGENGSGKTTLMNMLSGIYYPDEGQIYVHGEPVTIASRSCYCIEYHIFSTRIVHSLNSILVYPNSRRENIINKQNCLPQDIRRNMTSVLHQSRPRHFARTTITRLGSMRRHRVCMSDDVPRSIFHQRC